MVNQEVEQFLQLFVTQCQDDWDEWLSIAEFAYNDQVKCYEALEFFKGPLLFLCPSPLLSFLGELMEWFGDV